jgi:hypothetical protein
MIAKRDSFTSLGDLGGLIRGLAANQRTPNIKFICEEKGSDFAAALLLDGVFPAINTG